MLYQLFKGDCLEVMATLPAASIDLVLADPPYGTTACAWDSVIPFEPMWSELLRIGKASAAFVFTASQPFSSALVMSQPKLFRHEWIWIKNAGSNFANTVREPMKEHESVLVFSRGKWTYNKQMQERTGGGAARVKLPVRFDTSSDNYRDFGGRSPTMMPDLRVPSSWQKFNRERGLHPTQKPVDLMAYLVRTYSAPGQTVLDFTMGSGTTGVACAQESRRFVGIEKDSNHFNTAKNRVEEAYSGMDWLEAI